MPTSINKKNCLNFHCIDGSLEALCGDYVKFFINSLSWEDWTIYTSSENVLRKHNTFCNTRKNYSTRDETVVIIIISTYGVLLVFRQ